MNIRFVKEHAISGRRFAVASTADMPEEQARKLIREGVATDMTDEQVRLRFHADHQVEGGQRFKAGDSAVLVGDAAREAGDSADRTMLVRFKGPGSHAGKAYPAGERAELVVDDESWQLVNAGTAELTPGPGEAGQPFPPDWVNRDETTDVADPGRPPLRQAGDVRRETQTREDQAGADRAKADRAREAEQRRAEAAEDRAREDEQRRAAQAAQQATAQQQPKKNK